MSSYWGRIDCRCLFVRNAATCHDNLGFLRLLRPCDWVLGLRICSPGTRLAILHVGDSHRGWPHHDSYTIAA